MKRIFGWSLLIAALPVLGLEGHALAGSKPVEVVVTNYTSDQPFSPVACVVHDGTFEIYELGHAASEALRLIAEDADTSALQAAVNSSDSASSLVVGAGPIGPGATGTVAVQMDKKDFVSCVWMLVNTNDTFAAITAVPRPKKREPLRFHRIALDAGTEVNDQLEANIPGPCCMNLYSGVPEVDGSVLGSPGIVAGLGALTHKHDWRGSVAGVIVKRP